MISDGLKTYFGVDYSEGFLPDKISHLHNKSFKRTILKQIMR
jgi:hypothetical protein